MGEPWDTILRAAIALGIALFLGSVSSSMEKIAKALNRLADAEDVKRAAGTPPDRT